ncbi:hypothetical protein [Rhizobium sp. NLR13a]|uniref:hypothetical protein n=1 Tax=Rhizobium sp. NLR13a TaxID=2731109 RepID=UPI002180B2A1|nr:hypothetical protein [Rhizobium sp. NLR13a]
MCGKFTLQPFALCLHRGQHRQNVLFFNRSSGYLIEKAANPVLDVRQRPFSVATTIATLRGYSLALGFVFFDVGVDD